MRFLDPPSLDAGRRGRFGDDLDGLLSAFFRSEMPSPWPGSPVPEEAPVILRPRPVQTRRSSFRSRLALAASVALLISGSWLLSGSFKETPANGKSDVSVSTGTATTDDARPVKWKRSITETEKGKKKVKIEIEDLEQLPPE